MTKIGEYYYTVYCPWEESTLKQYTLKDAEATAKQIAERTNQKTAINKVKLISSHHKYIYPPKIRYRYTKDLVPKDFLNAEIWRYR